MSEAEGGAEGDAEVVVGSVVDPDLVAGFDAEAQRTGRRLDAAARIGGEVGGAVSELRERAGEGRSGGCVIAIAEFDEAGLGGDEGADRAGGLELRAEESGERPQVAGEGGAGDYIHEQMHFGGATSTAEEYGLARWAQSELEQLPDEADATEWHRLVRAKYGVYEPDSLRE